MAVVGTNRFHAVFRSEGEQFFIDLLLQGIGFAVGVDGRIGHFVALQLEVIVVPEHALEPLHGLLGFLNSSFKDFLRYLAAEAGGAADNAFGVGFEVFVVGTGSHVKAVYPRARHDFDEIMIAFLVFCKENEVPAALVLLAFSQSLVAAPRHVGFATEYRLEIGNALLLFNRLVEFLLLGGTLFGREGAIGCMERLEFCFCGSKRTLGFPNYLLRIIVKLLDAHHVAVVGHGHAAHLVADGLVYECGNGGLPVEDRILGVYVQMYKVFHSVRFIDTR